MRKFLFLALVFVFVMAFAGVAVANPDSWNPPGPTYRDPVTTGASPDSPHGSYATTNDECEICHSPHQAGTAGSTYKLLRGNNAASACDYCHANGGKAGSPYIVYVVGGVNKINDLNGHEIDAYTGEVPDDLTNGVDTVIGATLDCFDCHSVHGARTLTTAQFGGSVNGLTALQLPTAAILKRAPGGGANATNINEWCDSCHTANLVTVIDGISHYMGTRGAVLSTRGNIELATVDSDDCSDCHNPDGITGDDYVWPHNSRGEGLMEWTSAGGGPGVGTPVTRATMDANCLACHSGIIGSIY
ncbi:MAG: hypothetical protein Q8K99_08620 [Actinomycetota bacterium]|nr:hypothetical protein [Actinomycetota bacterium]